MKNTIKIIGIISLMLVIGFTFFSCSSDGGGGSSSPTPTPTPTPPPLVLPSRPGLYAKLPGALGSNDTPVVDFTGLMADTGFTLAITYINNHTTTTYTLLLDDDVTSVALSSALTVLNLNLYIAGLGANRTISFSNNGALFTVGGSQTLTLGSNITLQGRTGNTGPVVSVLTGGKLVMKSGSTITGNVNSASGGGGVKIAQNGTFVMEGGTISNNRSTDTSSGGGGGVYIDMGAFTMSGGTISGNAATGGTKGGGGVYMTNGQFKMSGGASISNNTSTKDGGGVDMSSGTFTMSGGTISGNTANAAGGGVNATGTFNMSGGKITGNTAVTTNSGGGVYVAYGYFNVNSPAKAADIYDNHSPSSTANQVVRDTSNGPTAAVIGGSGAGVNTNGW